MKKSHPQNPSATQSTSLAPCGCGGGQDEAAFDDLETLFDDEDADETAADGGADSRPCSRRTLDGSWLILIHPAPPLGGAVFQQITGPMRIESRTSAIRISGDIYVRRVLPRPTPPIMGPDSVKIGRNWYPSFAQKDYRWYFRSTGVRYSTVTGALTFKLVRHLWVVGTQEFGATDRGSMELKCAAEAVTLPGLPAPTVQMTGTLRIGGAVHQVTAIKTSPHYRGCLVEVDVMTNRAWPATATSCDGTQTFDFTGLYRRHGMDFVATVNQTNLTEDANLTTAELHSLLATHRAATTVANSWRLWILVGSRSSSGSFGVMFDDQAPHREGVVGFYDETLSNSPIILPAAQNQRIGDVPLAFLRTLTHEAGHAFNLFHPKHDVHTVPVGTTIMNQTGDIMSFATATNPFPCNATLTFDEHQRVSLIHSPDPQVKPGWKAFGWGHGSLSGGLAEPTDIAGLEVYDQAADLTLEVAVPGEVHIGEFVVAQLTLTNRSALPKTVPAKLNLAEGNMWAIVTGPTGDRDDDVRDIVYSCGEKATVELPPGGSLSGLVQLFYTNRGLLFRRTGTYRLEFELDLGDLEDEVVRSSPVRLEVQPPADESEQNLADLLMDRGVGVGLALGDLVPGSDAERRVDEAAEKHADTTTGLACGLLKANAKARTFRDIATGKVVRRADPTAAKKLLNDAVKGHDTADCVRAAVGVASPVEDAVPILEYLRAKLEKPTRGSKPDPAAKLLQDAAR